MEVETQPQIEPVMTKEEEELRDFLIDMENNRPTASQEEYFNSRPPLAFAEVFGGGYIVEFEDEEVSSQMEEESEAPAADVELVVEEAERNVGALSLSPQTQNETVGSSSSSSNKKLDPNGEEDEEKYVLEVLALLERRERKIMKSWPYWFREG